MPCISFAKMWHESEIGLQMQRMDRAHCIPETDLLPGFILLLFM
jgi:hypothetical protein